VKSVKRTRTVLHTIARRVSRRRDDDDDDFDGFDAIDVGGGRTRTFRTRGEVGGGDDAATTKWR